MFLFFFVRNYLGNPIVLLPVAPILSGCVSSSFRVEIVFKVLALISEIIKLTNRHLLDSGSVCLNRDSFEFDWTCFVDTLKF